jgi:hypothetical protein
VTDRLRLPRASIALVDEAIMADSVALEKARRLLEADSPETVVLASRIVAELSLAILKLNLARGEAYQKGGEDYE